MKHHLAKSLSMSEIQEIIKQTVNPAEDQALIELVCEYLKEHKQDYTPFDAKRWISVMSETHLNIPHEEGRILLVKKFKAIKNPGLVFYLKEKKIPIRIAQQHLTELEVYHSVQKKSHFVLGMSHEKDGFIVTSPFIQDWIGEPSISFIAGQNNKTGIVQIFHTFWDYLSLLAHYKARQLQVDAIILNSYECHSHIKGYVNKMGYQKAYTMLGNDESGKSATQKLDRLFQELNVIHRSMNTKYQSFPDLSTWYQHQAENIQ